MPYRIIISTFESKDRHPWQSRFPVFFFFYFARFPTGVWIRDLSGAVSGLSRNLESGEDTVPANFLAFIAGLLLPPTGGW